MSGNNSNDLEAILLRQRKGLQEQMAAIDLVLETVGGSAPTAGPVTTERLPVYRTAVDFALSNRVKRSPTKRVGRHPTTGRRVQGWLRVNGPASPMQIAEGLGMTNHNVSQALYANRALFRRVKYGLWAARAEYKERTK